MEKEEAERLEICGEYAYQEMLKNIEHDLKEFGIEFDSWFSERTLHPDKIQHAIDLLDQKGFIYEKEDAIWFKSSEFDDDKDRVIIKSDGSPTYLAADMAYHLDKLERGFDKLINVWGADHHGYVERMKAVVEALGYKKESLKIILVQLVSLLRDGKEITMSKRSGEFVTLREVVEETGVDAARYFYVHRSSDSHLDFDLELAKEESTDNPVYYIQYAHARICSILEQMEEEGIELSPLDEVELTKLKEEAELDLLSKLASYPREIAESAQSREVHHVARFLYDLATLFHKFYNKCHVLIEDKELMKARIILVLVSKQVLLNVLEILGVSAPENM